MRNPAVAGRAGIERRGRRFALGGLAGSLFVRTLFSTVRCEFTDRGDPSRPEGRVVFVCWHGQLLPLLYAHRNQGVAILVSEHSDGEYLARVLTRSGFRTVRGSSTSGGVRGLKGLVRAAREGHDLAITPDGPRGPARSFKPGALAVARLTGLPVVPVVAIPARSWQLRSWDGFVIPKPFSTVRIVYGHPVEIPRDTTDEALRELAETVAAELDTLGSTRGRTEERG